MADSVGQAIAAHEAVLEAKRRTEELSHERDQAVADAVAAGASVIELARALGVTRQRIYAMIRS